MKRLLSILLCICMLLGVLPVTAFAADTVDSGTCGDDLTWTLDSDGVLTISGTGRMAYYSGFDAPWYGLREQIKKIVFEEGATNISAAFKNCINLTDVILPDSLIGIGSEAFDGCSKLESVTIPKNVTGIDCSFHDCTKLTEIMVAPENQYFCSHSGVLYTKDMTTLIRYPIAHPAESYTIPYGVTRINYDAFYDTRNLKNISIPDSVTEVGHSAFFTSSLESVTIPGSVATVSLNSFQGSALQHVVIQNGTATIGSSAFYCCSNLTRVAIPNSITSIENYAFLDCEALTDVYYEGTEAEWNAITIGSDNEYLTNATIHYNSASTYSVGLSTVASSVIVGDTISVSVNVGSNGMYDGFSAAEIELAYSGNITFDQTSSSLGDAGVSIPEGTIKLVDKGASKNLGDGIYTLKFTANAAGSGEVHLVSAAFGTAEDAEAKDLTEAACNTTPLSFTINPQKHKVTLDPIYTGDDTVTHGSDYTFQKEATTGAYYDYELPTAKIGDTTVSVTANSNGSWTVSDVTGDLNISGTRTAKKYNVTIQGKAASQATYGENYTFTLPQDVAAGLEKGYTYALESVTIGGNDYSSYKAEDSNTYTIPGTDVTGNIVITYTETELEPNQFTVSVSGDAAGAAAGNFPTTVSKGDSFTLTLNPEAGYEYSVTAEGYEVTANGNKYTISSITGNVTFVITKSVITSHVTVSQYVTLDGSAMWLIKNGTAKLDSKLYTYDGKNMVWSEVYQAYCILVVSTEKPEPKAADFSIITGTVEELIPSKDVNQTSTVDANDAQLVYNIYMTRYKGFTETVTMQKFLLADVNGDGKVNMEDASAIVSFLLS